MRRDPKDLVSGQAITNARIILTSLTSLWFTVMIDKRFTRSAILVYVNDRFDRIRRY